MADRGTLTHLAARVLNTPLAMTQRKLDVILQVLGPRLGLDVGTVDMTAPVTTRSTDMLVQDGVAVLPVFGTLVKRTGSAQPESGMTPVGAVAEAFRAAMTDPAVRGILLQVDSDGGEVGGIFDLADEMFAARGTKPVWAVADEAAYSAAYALASAADRVLLARTAGVGSIGVIAVHVDASKAHEAAGITPTIVRSGARKAEHNSLEPLTPAALASLQAEVDRVNDLFVATVARQRGLDPAAVRALEGATVQGADAIAAGLADEIATMDEAFRALAAAVSRTMTPPNMATRRHRMAEKVGAAEVIDLDAAREEGRAKGAAEATACATAAERERTKAIRDTCRLGMLAGLSAEKADALADELMASGATADAARDAVLQARAAHAGPEVHARIGTDAGPGSAPRLDPNAIYAKRREAILASNRGLRA